MPSLVVLTIWVSDVSLRRTQPGTGSEHWALHFHDPISPGHVGDVGGTTVDAQLNKGAPGYVHGTSPLETTTGNVNQYHVKPHQLTHIATLDATQTQQAKTIAQGVHCTNPPLAENCADWTRKVVGELHTQGLLTQKQHDDFVALHNGEIAGLRVNTDHHFT
jgi:hypothetical protein